MIIMKTRNTGIIYFVLMLCIAFSSCEELGICQRGEGVLETRTILIPDDFEGFDLRIEGNVYVTQGAAQSVEVEGQGNIIDLLKTDVENGIWKIGFRGCVNEYDELNIRITLPILNAIKVSGSGNVEGQSVFDQSDVLDVKITGSGNVKLQAITEGFSSKITGSGNMDVQVEAADAESEITGSGNISLAGSTIDFDVRVAGSGDVRAFDFVSDVCETNILGAGNIEVSVQTSLDVKIGGSGNVRYKGQPSLSVNITGSGSVEDAN